MASTRAMPTFDGLPQELRDKIYLEHIRDTTHTFTVKAVSGDETECQIDSIFTLRHPLQAVNRKILHGFEDVAFTYARHIRLVVTDFDFDPVATVFKANTRALDTAGFAMKRDEREPSRSLIINFVCTDTSIKRLAAGLEEYKATGKLLVRATVHEAREHRWSHDLVTSSQAEPKVLIFPLHVSSFAVKLSRRTCIREAQQP